MFSKELSAMTAKSSGKDFGGVLGVGISGTKTSALVPSRKIWVWIVPETLVEEVVTATGASSSIGVSL